MTHKTIGHLLGSRWASLFLLCVFFWIVAAASFSGFMGKWALRDGDRRNGIEKMLDGTAHKPFVYRQLGPMAAGLANKVVPAQVKNLVVERMNPHDIFARASAADSREIGFAYVMVCYLSFIGLFLSLFFLRAIVLHIGCGQFAAILAPVSLVLAFPYLLTGGGYFYDSIELLFFCLAFFWALQGNVIFLVASVAPATLNKETFFFFVPTLYPILRTRFGKRDAAAIVLLMVLVSGGINAVIKMMFAESDGSAAEFHLVENLQKYVQLWTYLKLEITYGIVGPKGMSIVTLIAVTIIVYRGWAQCSYDIKQHILIALALNLILAIFFATVGELRNFGFLFIALAILIANAVDQFGYRGRAAI